MSYKGPKTSFHTKAKNKAKALMRFVIPVCILLVLLCLWVFQIEPPVKNIKPQPQPIRADSPLNATYRLPTSWAKLHSSPTTHRGSDQSTSYTPVSLVHPILQSDLDQDGDDDAVLILTTQSSATESEYYLAAAIQDNGTFQGSKALWLGRGIAPSQPRIWHGLIIQEYSSSTGTNPKASREMSRKSFYATLENGRLKPFPSLKTGNALLAGFVYSQRQGQGLVFRPCGERQPEYRITACKDAEQKCGLLQDVPRTGYIPRFVVCAGKKISARDEVEISRIIRLDARGNCQENVIVLTNPLPGQRITSPLTIQGRARGSWYFEGDFPVVLTNWDGLIIAEGVATAKGQWMTQKFVPFTCSLSFATPDYGEQGTLILHKDNPSGKPALERALEIPVRFQQEGQRGAGEGASS